MVESTKDSSKEGQTVPQSEISKSQEIDREALKLELLAEAKKILDGWDSYPLQKHDTAKGLISKTFPQPNGLTGLIVKYVSKKMTLEHVKKLADDREHHMNTMNP